MGLIPEDVRLLTVDKVDDKFGKVSTSACMLSIKAGNITMAVLLYNTNNEEDLVPAKSQNCDVLQRGMLALAAMDLAYQYTNGEELSTSKAARYRERALHHQQAALPGFRELIQSPDLSDRNGAFLFSIMLIILAFGTAHSATTKPTLEDILDFFALFRGPKTLWQLHGDVANAELVERMSPKTVFPPPYPPDEDETMKKLTELSLDEVCAEARVILYGAWAKYDANREDVRSIAFVSMSYPEVQFKLANDACSFLQWLQRHSMTRFGGESQTLFIYL